MTISGKDLEASTRCMDNKHPLIPETINCFTSFYSSSFVLQKSIKQLLTIVNLNYASGVGSFKIFPGIQSGALTPKANAYSGNQDAPDLARFRSSSNNTSTGWYTPMPTSSKHFKIGSSIPFVYEKIVVSGRIDIDNWISLFRFIYSRDGYSWIEYNNVQIIPANKDQKEPVEIIFKPFTARTIITTIKK